jgi:hypothetical protein
MNDHNLRKYLNAHLTGSVAGIELVKRAAEENRGSDLGSFLKSLLTELEEDRVTVRRILKATGKDEDILKKLGGWMLEKVAESRLHDLAGDSPHMRRVIELEGIIMGTSGRICMWRLLELFHRNDPRLKFADFTFLRQRAEEQADELELYRQAEAGRAFAA